MVTSIASGARAMASRAPTTTRPTTPGALRGEGDNGRGERSLQSQLTSAQAELAAKQRARLDQEIRTLTTRYSGDEALARRVAEARAARNFAASDPNFAGEIAPLQQRITDLEQQIQRAARRRGGQTIGGGNGETLGGN